MKAKPGGNSPRERTEGTLQVGLIPSLLGSAAHTWAGSSPLWACQPQGLCEQHIPGSGDGRWHCSSSSVPSDAFTGEQFSSGAIPHLVPPCQRWGHRPKAVQVTMISWRYHLCTSTSTLQPPPQTPKTDHSTNRGLKVWSMKIYTKGLPHICPAKAPATNKPHQPLSSISPDAQSSQPMSLYLTDAIKYILTECLLSIESAKQNTMYKLWNGTLQSDQFYVPENTGIGTSTLLFILQWCKIPTNI